jgi:hypothetical protein
VNAVAWLSTQSFGAPVPRGQATDTSAAIVSHWRARIASGVLSTAQVKVAEQIIASELGRITK